MRSANRWGTTLSTNRHPWWRDAVPVAFGTTAYLIIIFLHPYLFGVAVNPF